MVLNLYFPPANYRSGRNWHLSRKVDGCQWVTEPVLSPLLYKSFKKRPTVSGEYRVGSCKSTAENYKRKFKEEFFMRLLLPNSVADSVVPSYVLST